MFISKFTAFNYRSLKDVKIRFENGKNVLVGKNNSGKSNIIKALDILLSERFPTYQNITPNDFHTYEVVDFETGEISECIAENMYIDVQLEGRDFDVDMIRSIKKKTAFCRIKSVKQIYSTDETGNRSPNYDLFQQLDELENRPEVGLVKNEWGKDQKTIWKTPEELITFLGSLKTLKLFFCKSRIDDEKSGFGILCQDENKEVWITPFLSKKLRNSLITTTVISALRSQKEDLRLVHYTWFGKLIMGLWDKNKNNIEPKELETYEELIRNKSLDIKFYVDQVFDKETKQIRLLLEGAIAHKKVSFKFLNDTTSDLYKNIQLFVDDGIDRPLQEKGTGIQSAIIISLFTLYCNNYHNNSSLLITEEPELYLHPQARRVISAELNKFLANCDDQPRQLIISTHSTEYLKNVDPYSIVRVHKENGQNATVANQLDSKTSQSLTLELKRFLWTNNTELFFSDKVILVEGGEVYLIPSLVDKLRSQKQLLDYKNISVIRVNGKGSFLTYIRMLECFNIKYLILGDLDCFRDEVTKIANYLQLTDIKDKLAAIKKAIVSLPVDYNSVAERLRSPEKNLDAQKVQKVFEQIVNEEIIADDANLRMIVSEMQKRYVKGDKRGTISAAIDGQSLNTLLEFLRSKGIFIWAQGELENYYTESAVKLEGNSKDMKALQLSYLLQEEATAVSEYFKHVDELDLLVACILNEPPAI